MKQLMDDTRSVGVVLRDPSTTTRIYNRGQRPVKVTEPPPLS